MVMEKISNNLWVIEVLSLAIIISTAIFYLFLIPLRSTKNWPKLHQSPTIKIILWGLFFLGLFIYGFLQLSIFYNLGSPMRDVAIFDQAIWHLSRFEAPASTLRGIPNLWGDHFHPILVLITPLYWLKSDVRWLFVLQAAVVSAGIFPIFAIARDKLKSNFAGLAFAFSWLFFLGVQHAIRFGFYPETLAITFLAFAIYFLFKKKIWQYFLFIFLALACKENISLYIVFLGLWAFFWPKARLVGLLTLILGLTWFKLTVGFLIPHLAGAAYQYFRYEALGNSPLAVLKTIIFHPIYTLKIAFSPGKFANWLAYFVPFGFLSLFSSFLFVLIPVMAEKFLSTDPKFWVMGYHYGASAVTFLVVSAILASSNILNLSLIKKIRLPKSLKAAYIGLFLVVLSLFFSFNKSENPFYAFGDKDFWQFHFPANYHEAIKLIPPDKSLTAQMTLGTALAHRQEIYWWSDYPEQKKGDFILLSTKYSTFPYSIEQHRQRIKDLLANGEYGIRYSSGDIILLEKDLKESKPLSEEFKSFIY